MNALFITGVTTSRYRGATLCLLLLASAAHGQTTPPGPVTPELTAFVRAYFTTPEKDERKAIAEIIEKTAQRDARTVAQAIREAHLWPAGPEGATSIFFPDAGRPSVAGVFEVPFGYHSQQRYPLLVCIPDAGQAPEVMLARARLFLKEHVTEFVVLGTTAKVVGGFHQGSEAGGKLRTLIRKLGEQVRLDRNRIYVLGVGEGANAAWLAGINHSDLFAGVVAINGYPELPYPEASYPIFLENLRHTPVLTVWNKPPPASGTGPTLATKIAAHNRLITELASATSLPIRSMEVASTDRPDVQPPVAAISEIVSLDRVTMPKKISHWFRYPEHGATSWLRQITFAGNIWDESTISIAPGPNVDRLEYLQKVLRSKLAYVGGEVEGQTVTLNVARTRGVELALPLGAFAPGSSVRVVCNGRIRHEDKFAPDIPTMLKSAYDRWDFQNPVGMRLSLSVKTD